MAQRTRRPPVGPSSTSSTVADEFVAFAVHRPDDQLLAAIVTDGLADRLDPRRERGLAHEAVTPDRVEQFFLAHHGAAVLDEVCEHVEHLRLDPDLLATASKDDAVQVQFAIGESDHLSDRSRGEMPLTP